NIMLFGKNRNILKNPIGKMKYHHTHLLSSPVYGFYDNLSYRRQSFRGYGLTFILTKSNTLYNKTGLSHDD
ncbi:MAG: hypothetical protein PUH62_05485, partial [Megasphaera elsdenii]|nr:hypothetical protein [Megasphaera elsdenii]